MRTPAATLLVLLPSLSAAQEEGAYIHQGLSEVSLNAFGAWNQPEGTDIDQFNVGANAFYGLFLTDWFQLGVKGEYDFAEIETPGTEVENHSLLAGPQITVNLVGESPVIPFAVAAGGVAYTRTEVNDLDDDEAGAFWEAGGGIRLFLSQSASVNLSVVFRQLLFEDIRDSDSVVGSAGISIYF